MNATQEEVEEVLEEDDFVSYLAQEIADIKSGKSTCYD